MVSKQSENLRSDQLNSDPELSSSGKKLLNLHTEVEIKPDPERILQSSLIYKCSACLDLFKTQNALKEHKFNHKNDFLCDTCQKSFPDFYSLVKHENRHRSKKKKKSPKQKVATVKQLTITEQGPKKKPITKQTTLTQDFNPTKESDRTHCKLCAKTYENHKKLQSRGVEVVGNRYPILVLRFNPPESPIFKCCNCNDQVGSFKDLSELINHQRSHTKTKSCDFECDICGRLFTQTGSLARHKLFHNGERKYGCNICELRFVQPSDLKKHLRTHTGERPYGCEMCGKRFKTREHVKLHYIRIHSSERNFNCGKCSSWFKTSQDLNCHTAREHPGLLV